MTGLIALMRDVSACCSFLVLVAFCGGCQRSPEVAELKYSVRDSAGIQLVVAGGPSRPDSLLQYRETLRITGDTGGPSGEPFFRVGFVRVDAAGRIYVADSSRKIRLFDTAGRFVRDFGGTGEGPGEFRSIIEVLVRGDTVAVNDLQLARVTRFDGAGDVVDIQPTRQGDRLLMLYGLVPGGWLANLHVRKPSRSGLARDTVVLRLVSSAAAAFGMADEWKTASDPGSVRVPTAWTYYMKSGSWKWGPLWTPVPSFGMDAAGRVFVSEGLRYDVRVYEASGRLVRQVTNSHKPVPITPALVERYAEAVRAKAPPGRRLPVEQKEDDSESSELSRLQIPYGDVLPALGTLLVGPDGSLWVERPDLTEDPVLLEVTGNGRTARYWDILDENSRYVGTVGLPMTFLPRAAKGLTVYGVSLGEDDVESVVAYTVAARNE